jgi:negative regulator of sigma E activity
MKTNRYEHLSALLDDEAGEFERRRLLDELCEDTELGKALNRYTLVGEAMRQQQRTVVASGGFLAGIQAQLEDEPVYNQVVVPSAANVLVQGGKATVPAVTADKADKKMSVAQPWYRAGSMRYALAASVALAALAGILVVQNNDVRQEVTEGDTLAVTPPAANVAAAGDAVSGQPPVLADAVVGGADSTTDTANTTASLNRRMTLADASLGRQTADTLKQYVTLHMQYRSSNGIAPSIQAVSYAK